MRCSPARWALVTLLLMIAPGIGTAAEGPRRPNVVLVMTDDQGYGDLACHGNRQIRTPALDALHADSVRLANYHVDPTCSPTRSALMTGRYSSRTGVWHTVGGRSILRQDETTLAQLFQRAGYRTGIFGKWHLGDNYPYRPQERGFDEALTHGGGGVGQTPDHWGNDYFGDTYLHNGRPETFDGYCTDVWFGAAERFIRKNADQPFFCYLPTNAPHSPYNIDPRYSRPYAELGVPSPRAEFYGMIANIDENVARLRRTLDELGLAENTLFIFATDNGSAAGTQKGGFTAGMRGHKGSEYDGGHRVPCFLHWPAGGLTGGRDVPQLTAHIDLLPTLADLCGLPLPMLPLDGRSLVPLLALRDGVATSAEGKRPARIAADQPRTLFVHSQRIEHPEKWRKCAVLRGPWRLVNGKELYDLRTDPGQTHDLADQHPQQVAELRDAYDAWWADLSQRFDEYCRIVLGAPQASPVQLCCHDWHPTDDLAPSSPSQLEKNPAINGLWAVEVARPGRYEITLRARPEPVVFPLPAGTARVRVGDATAERPIPAGDSAVTIPVDLPAGPAMLQTWLAATDGPSRGAFFVTVRRVGD